MFYLETEKYGEFTSEYSFVCNQYSLIFCIVINFILFTFITILSLFFDTKLFIKGNFKITKYFVFFHIAIEWNDSENITCIILSHEMLF